MATNNDVRLYYLTSGSSTADAASYAMASVAPTSGRRLYAAAWTGLASGADPVEPTASGTNGLSGAWSVVATIAINDGATKGWRLTLFRSTAVSSVAGVLTVSYGAETQASQCWSLLEATNTPEAPQQSKTAGNAASGAALGATLDTTLLGERSITFGVFGCGVSGVSNAPAAGYYRAVGDTYPVSSADATVPLGFVYQIGDGLTITPGYGTRIGRAAIVVELANANAGGGYPIIGEI